MQRFSFFDLDDTLVDRARAFPQCVSGFCRRFSLGAEVETWLVDEMYERAYREDFARLKAAFRLPASVDVLWSGYCESMAGAVTCASGTLAGLRRLRSAGWRLAVVTNGAGDIQRAKLRRTGLASLVDAVCVSEEVGVRKPEAGIFGAAGRLLGLSALDGGWMVGDSLWNDVVGGRAAGLRTVWVADGSVSSEADHCVASAAEAVELLLAEGGAADA